MEESNTYEISVYDASEDNVLFDRTSHAFCVATTMKELKDDGRTVQNVFMMSNNLTPQVTSNICLALLNRDPEAKAIFRQAFENLAKREAEQKKEG